MFHPIRRNLDQEGKSVTKFSFNLFKRSSRAYPKIYQVEVFAGCNLKCPLCHAGRREIGRDTKFLHLNDFKAIFDKIKPHAELLYLHIWGEPTLNKHLVDMVTYVHQQNRVASLMFRRTAMVCPANTHSISLERGSVS